MLCQLVAICTQPTLRTAEWSTTPETHQLCLGGGSFEIPLQNGAASLLPTVKQTASYD